MLAHPHRREDRAGQQHKRRQEQPAGAGGQGNREHIGKHHRQRDRQQHHHDHHHASLLYAKAEQQWQHDGNHAQSSCKQQSDRGKHLVRRGAHHQRADRRQQGHCPCTHQRQQILAQGEIAPRHRHGKGVGVPFAVFVIGQRVDREQQHHHRQHAADINRALLGKADHDKQRQQQGQNVKFTDDVRDFTSYSFKPQLKTVGPKYGKMLGGIKKALDTVDGNAAMDELNANGSLNLDVDGQEITLFKEDLLIDTAQIEGYVSENDNGITVVLDTNLTEELLEEGFVREIISKIQTMRKEAGFEVMDKIRVTYTGSEKAESIFAKYAESISSEVLAEEVTKAEPAGYVKEWKINGEQVTMGVWKEGM